MEFKTVFVTVGTTSFDELIGEVNTRRMVELLKTIGCKRLIIQYGRGPEIHLDEDLFADLEVELYGLKSSITPDIEAADLIVGHAGAGTCLEVLKARKPLIVVTNDTLMDNHQMELSRALTAQGVVRSCYVSDLSRAISTLHPKTLKQITAGHPEIFQAELDALMGYSTATS